jgi:hypothetical protein
MMPYQTYRLWQIERPKTTAERRATDAQRGMFAAAVSRAARRATSATRPAARARLGLARAVWLRGQATRTVAEQVAGLSCTRSR